LTSAFFFLTGTFGSAVSTAEGAAAGPLSMAFFSTTFAFGSKKQTAGSRIGRYRPRRDGPRDHQRPAQAGQDHPEEGSQGREIGASGETNIQYRMVNNKVLRKSEADLELGY
jgi:hypothetical protein